MSLKKILWKYDPHKDGRCNTKITRLKNTYVMEMLRHTVLIAVLCGGLVLTGQQLVRASLTGLWLPLVVLLLFGLVRVMQYQRYQISGFGKNGTHIMSR